MYLYTIAEAECCCRWRGEAAQERRVAAFIARGINWLSLDCQLARDHSIRIGYIGSAVGCMSTLTFYETAAPGERHLGQGVLRCK